MLPNATICHPCTRTHKVISGSENSSERNSALTKMNPRMRFVTCAIGAGVLALNSSRACAAPPPAPTTVTPLAHVEERGTGPITMILIPGLSCDWRIYDAFMTRNASKYRMLAVTLPGFGGSTAPPIAADASPMDGKWLLNAQAAILKLIQERKLDKPVIVGHSLGGHLAIQLAAGHGEHIKSAISIDGLPLFPPPPPGQPDTAEARATMVKQFGIMMNSMPVESWADGQKRSVAMLVTDPARAKVLGEICAEVPKANTVEYMLEMIGSDLRPQMGKIQIPLLTISAVSNDAGPEMAANIRAVVRDEFKGASPSVKLVTFEDSRHFIMDDRPADLDQAIATFLAGGKVDDVVTKKAAPAQVAPVQVTPAPATSEAHRQ